jgi:peptide chain release factor 2
MGAAGFWDNQTRAQDLVKQRRTLSLSLKPLRDLKKSLDDLQVLVEFVDEGAESPEELSSAAEALAGTLDTVELQAMLSAPEDVCGAYLSVQAGEGGTDASDFAAMLLRMYQRWAEEHGYAVEEVDLSEAEEAGIRSATINIKGDYAYGYLKGEVGLHRLIRISPFDANARRQTSFAAIDLIPDMDEDASIEINWDDPKVIREDVFRSSGAGGQKVNKTSSAIRLTHLPTGVAVQCQNERSQHKNRALARKMLVAKLYQMEQDKRTEEAAAKRDTKSKIGFGGGTLRTYTLQPQQLVKDHRTYQTATNPGKVLDGDIDPFIHAYLRWRMGKVSGTKDNGDE